MKISVPQSQADQSSADTPKAAETSDFVHICHNCKYESSDPAATKCEHCGEPRKSRKAVDLEQAAAVAIPEVEPAEASAPDVPAPPDEPFQPCVDGMSVESFIGPMAGLYQTPPLASVYDAESAYIEAAREVERIYAEIERLQVEHQEAVDHHRKLGEELCRVLERRLRETLAETECEVKIKSRESASLASNQTYSTQPHSLAAPPISEQPTGDYSSLTAAISELWDGNPIERFGPKKQEALIDACPTIGDFERLREQAGRSWKPLHSLLPDKIGESVADELENRFVEWWKKNAADNGECVDYTTKATNATKAASESGDAGGDVDMGPQRGSSSAAKIAAESRQISRQVENATESQADAEQMKHESVTNDTEAAESEPESSPESTNPYQF